jgi:DNA-binding transcriptional LysR family regulator
MISSLRRNTWNWLPAFLEVAETGSVAQASRNLNLTPAAVSRTVRLLEEEMGEQLFNRVGRSLALNTRGAALRDAVRVAIGAVDRGLSESLGDPYAGPLRVASLGVLTQHFVVPCLIELKREHESLMPEHLNLPTADANAGLVRGELEVAFYYEQMTVDQLVVERLGETTTSVYCGKGHPLFGKRRVTRADVQRHPFSVPQIGDTGRVMDGWPAQVPRQVGMRITLLRSNLDVCLSGTLLTVLPDVTAAPHVRARGLRRLPFSELPPIEVFAARHQSAPERGRVRRLIEAVRTRLRQVNEDLAQRRKRKR